MPALALLAWAVLLIAWVMGNAPFAAPDEIDHYIRAVGVSEGHLIGDANPGVRVGATPTQIAWTAQAARDVPIPADLDPRALACMLARELRARCPGAADPNSAPETLLTTVGNYQPLPYLVPAALLRASDSAPVALRLGRTAEALTALALLALAVYALYDTDSPLVSLLGLLLAATPMALFCSASLGGSGPEIAAAAAFVSCMLRTSRPGPASARWWILAGLSGAMLALSRSDGPLWLALVLFVWAAWSSPWTRARRRSVGRGARLFGASLVLAVTLNAIWELSYGSHVALDTSQLRAGLSAGAREWWRALPELVGKFGYVNVKLPLILPLAWFVLVLALWTAAYAVSEQSERRVLSVVLAAGLLGPVAFYALIIRPTGFGLQGRHVLPFLLVVPLLAGEALYRHRERLSASRLRLLAGAVPLVVGAVQAIAWYVNARRYFADSSERARLLGQAAWVPPAGWWPWLIVALLAGLCLSALAVAAPGRSAPSGVDGPPFSRLQRDG